MTTKELMENNEIPDWCRPLHIPDTDFKYKIEDNVTGETVLLTNNKHIAFEFMMDEGYTYDLYFSHASIWWRVE